MHTGTNPTSLHRQQVLRQIVLPFGIGLLLVAAAGIGFGLGGVGSASVWADVGLVWLSALTMIAGLIVLAVLVAALAGVIWLLRWIPPQAARVQSLVARVPRGVGRGADALTRPVIAVRAAGRALTRLWRRGES